MLRVRTVRVLLLAALLVACTGPVQQVAPGPAEPVDSPAPPVISKPGKADDPPSAPPVAAPRLPVRFLLFEGPPGYRGQDRTRELKVGPTATVTTDPIDLDIVLANYSAKSPHPTVHVKGLELDGGSQWSDSGTYSLHLPAGKADDQVTLSVEAPGAAPAILSLKRAVPAQVTVDLASRDAWKPVTILSASTLSGPGTVRLLFSKPVRREEVEQALIEQQGAPVRGLMQWPDDSTLIWQITQMPPRLDFLLGAAHDRDGLPLPGGIPSVRLGELPGLAIVAPAPAADQGVATLPPDVINAGLTRDAKYLNLTVWTPGTTRWDWSTTDLYLDLQAKSLKSGRMGDPLQPRTVGDLESWVISPPGTTLAGIRPAKEGGPAKADLVIMDLRGGRQQVYPAFIDRDAAGDHTVHLAWSFDGTKVAAISYKAAERRADLVSLDLPSGYRAVLVENLPLTTGAAYLSWSGNGRWLQAGNLLVDVQTKEVRNLTGDVSGRGVWEPGGARLLYAEKDWGAVFMIDPAGAVESLGTGLMIDWAGPGKAYVIRWPASNTRYEPPGQYY